MKSFVLAGSALLSLAQAQGWQIDPAVTGKGPVHEIPALGFGTWSLPKDDSGVKAVASAIKLGYRSIDGATAYQNQPWVGKGIAKALAEDKTITRDQLFVTSKIWSTRHPTAGANATFEGLEANLSQLGLDYLDLALVHFPVGTNAKGETSTAKNDIVEMWAKMEELLEKKNPKTGKPLVRKIGISNYNVTQIEQLLASAKVKPYVHQIELHPYLQQNDFLDFHKKHGIKVVAYAPLGNTNPEYAYRAKMTKPLLQDETLTRIAKKRGCASTAQVALAWNLKRGITVIPRAKEESHQKENYRTVSDCKLTDADMASIKRLDIKARYWDMCCTLGLPCYLGLDGALDETPVSDDYCAAKPELSRTSNAALFKTEGKTGAFELPVAFKSSSSPTRRSRF